MQTQVAAKTILESQQVLRFDPTEAVAVGPLRLQKLSRQDWLALAPSMLGYNFRQSWAYGQAVAKHFGATSEHVGIFRHDCCVGLADVRVRQIPVLGGGIAYVSGGPLILADSDTPFEQALRWSLQILVDEYVRHRGLILRVSPPIEWASDDLNVDSAFRDFQFAVPDHLARYRTFLVDLTPTVEQLRRNLDSRWRTCLKHAEKQNFTIHAGHGVDLLESFCPLFRELVSRKGFSVELSADFYRQLQDDVDAGEKFHVKLVESEGQIIGGHIGSVLGRTSVALLVASSQTGYDLKAAHLLHWRSIVEAKEHGCQWYDLGGIDPVAVPGVYQFKRLIRGIDLTAHGPFELNPSGFRNRLTTFAEVIYRKLRHRRTKSSPEV